MTLLQVASLPFWALALFFLVGAIAIPLGVGRKLSETADDLWKQSFQSFLAFAVFFMFAALLWR